jgi:spore germination protein
MASAGASHHGVTVWLPYWDISQAVASTLAHAGVVQTASPYLYTIAGDATLKDEPDAPSAATLAQIEGDGVKVMPMVTENAGLYRFAQILESPRKRAAMVNTLVGIGSQPGFAGVDLDFETFAVDPKHERRPANRISTLYPRLVAAVCGALHKLDRGCQVTVMPRTTSGAVYWHGDLATWAYDYAALGRAADRVQVMAYDQHAPGDAPGAVAPLPWVKQVIAYTRSQMAPARAELGVPAYGYNWDSVDAPAVTAVAAVALAKQVHAHLHWSRLCAEETFSYRQHGEQHTVWFEDARANRERAQVAAAAGFYGIAIWAAGYEQPSLWPQLATLQGGG